MAAPEETADDDEIPAKSNNAFSRLMTTARQAKKNLSPNPHSTTLNPELVPPLPPTTFSGRAGLGVFLSAPETFTANKVLFYSSSCVAVPDLYPKAAVHALLLPRDLSLSMRHPLVALQDETVLAAIRPEAERLKKLVAAELRRRFGAVSAQEAPRREAMARGDEHLSQGRDWEREVMVGIHAGPSMMHLHVHVLSRDMVSECMRHRKHYNSFNTDFFVPLDRFPLGEGEVERTLAGRAGWLAQDFLCWRCGKNFGNRFKELKAHLEREFEEWKKV